ncbi:MAG: poly-beta-hydroxybutyrate polymerase N-terminal domain-containing protein, partial [Rhodobacter sp.]
MTKIGKSDDRVRVARDTGVTLKKAAGDDGAKAGRRKTVDLAGALTGAAEDPARTPPAPDPAGTVARVPAVMPPQPQPVPEPHRYAALDRSVMAGLARLTAGLSPHAMLDAWSDWAMHLSRAPGRQLELAERAQSNWIKLFQYTTAGLLGTTPDKPFTPGPNDTRWSDPGWDKAP